ncbi:threonine/serine dehydratase [Granulosicoccus sp.]|nr:threonine/serine dehydratase [Granulosicoccus sp.]
MTTKTNAFAISIADINQAADRLAPVAVQTPMLECPYLNELAGRRVLIKAEVLQRTGSFKFRGAWNAISALDDDVRSRGVIAYSSGNHAQGIAHAATMFGIPAVVVMPADSPKLKLANTKALGAEVVTYDRAGGESREAVGVALARERQLTLIKPYDDPMVMAGQGTVGLEIAEQAAAMNVTQADVLVCCGGGGLSSGIAIALNSVAPNLRVRPVEPQAADDTCRSLKAGLRLANEGNPDTFCDAIVTPMPGELTFPILHQLAGPGLCVDDKAVLTAMGLALMRLKLVVEPGGAVALAAALNPASINGDAVVCVVTGGNVDPTLLASAANHCKP